eukprot:7379817-Prymnesium_polylepis.2
MAAHSTGCCVQSALNMWSPNRNRAVRAVAGGSSGSVNGRRPAWAMTRRDSARKCVRVDAKNRNP